MRFEPCRCDGRDGVRALGTFWRNRLNSWQVIEFCGLSGETDRVAEAMTPGHRRTRLVRIELPRVHVEHHRLSLARVDVLHGELRQRERQQPEVPAATNRQVRAEQPHGADGELEERGRSVTDFEGKAGASACP